MFSRISTKRSTSGFSVQIARLRRALDEADAVVIGAGAGLSTAAGFTYNGERFERYFSDFAEKYGFHDMYSGGFYSFPSQEEFWAYWSRYIFINRYQNAPKSVHEVLLELVRDKDYFVITTNVDHCFQKAGFDKKRLFYTQGDYGLFQCSEPCCQETFDNEKTVRAMVEAQGFAVADGVLTPPTDGTPTMTVPSELLPGCPHCGRPMTMNLRCDNKFAEDEGWHAAAERYENFLRTRDGQKILFLELSVGYNTPVIIKYPFLRMTAGNPKATCACINMGQASTLREIEERSILIDGDIAAVIEEMKKTASYK
ncbi:MAG: SIR2 family NAD-dependent protein deacylase [Oscillibacter sp.]|nr:Sir2 silent information regulator family NAD-dependent deacetylase [Oscillospiraceae bacterium]